MKNLRPLIVVLAFLLSISDKGYSQESQDSTMYSIETKDGNEYLGKIRLRDQEKIMLLTENLGELTIFLKDIKSVNKVSEKSIKDGQFWFENPQAARYFWAPNGYGLKKGEGYYQNVWILFNQVSVGVTDHFSLGAGMIPAFIFAGAPTPVWITPKFSIPVKKDKFNLGVGVLAGAVIGEPDTSFGILFGSATIGSKDKNLSLGLGYGFAGGEMADRPVINVSGMLRIGPRGYLITENYYIGVDGETVGALSFGGRKIVKKLSIDFGGIIPFGSDVPFIMIPWLGIAVPLGGNKQIIN